jgi:hypothetical protein
MLASRAAWAAEGDRASLEAHVHGGLEVELTEPEPEPWSIIWRVGGLCWLVVTGTAILWMLPASGSAMDGIYVVTTQARAAQHLLVFLAAALAYRVAIALGWPVSLWEQASVIAVNTLLALAVVSFSQVALALVAGFIDHHPLEMGETFDSLAWAMSLRLFLPPYTLGLCAIALVLVAHRQHREALRAAQLSSAYAAARMAMLSAQLQPHFLFNSLHAISVLIDDSPRQAAVMVARLGDFLRYALDCSHRPWIDLASELGGLGAYLAVQQTRFSDRLTIVIDASPESLRIHVPSLLLQPLAENAIEHGRKDCGPLQVRVTARVSGERLHITVRNSSPRLADVLSPASYGHGLSNVDLRLRAAYGADAQLTIGPDSAGGTSAILDLPPHLMAGMRTQPR